MFVVVDSWLLMGCVAARSGGGGAIALYLSGDRIISIRFVWLYAIKNEQWTIIGATRKRDLRTSKGAFYLFGTHWGDGKT